MENKMKRHSKTKGEIKIKGWKGKQEENQRKFNVVQ